MVGDYNYPVFKDNLAEKVREAGYELTLSDSRTYTRYKFFRGHFDLATSVGFDDRARRDTAAGVIRSPADPRRRALRGGRGIRDRGRDRRLTHLAPAQVARDRAVRVDVDSIFVRSTQE